MGCSTCGKKYPRSGGSSSSSALTMSKMPTILTQDQKRRSNKGVIKAMKSEPSKGMIQPDTEAAIPGTPPDCGPIIPATGQPESWVTQGTAGDGPKLVSPMDSTLSVDNKAQGTLDD